MSSRDPLLRRGQGLLARDVGGETVVYDQETHRVTQLDASAAVIWAALREPRSMTELAALASLSLDEAGAVVARLHDAGLIDESGLSRRALLARAGAVAWTVPLVSIVAPAAAYAQSPACLPPDLSLTTLSLGASSIGRSRVDVEADISGIPTSCSCGDGFPKIEGNWQEGSAAEGWVTLPGSGTGTTTSTSSATFSLGQNGVKTFTFNLRVTCPGADGVPVWSCKRAALRVRRDGNSSNLQTSTAQPSGSDPCDVPPPTYP